MQTITLTLPRPHPAQRQVLDGARRFNAVACGRRWGKTKLGINRLLSPGTVKSGLPVGWFSPTYKMLREVWRECVSILKPVTSRSDSQEHRIELITGGVIDMWSLENADSVRGRKYRRVIIDEAGLVPNLAIDWSEAIRPTLTDYRGDGWFLGTPKGHNFFWQVFQKGQDPQEHEYASWQMPTGANPFIHQDEVDAARSELPERSFRQEYLAEFIEESGGVFRRVSEAVDAGRAANDPRQPTRHYCLGVDIARVEDFTVLSVLDGTGRQVYHERFNQISWERQLQTIARVARAYGATVLIDSTGIGDPIFEALRSAGLAVQGYQFTNTSKEALIDALALSLEHSELRLMDIAAQTTELLAFQYELTPTRKVRMAAPEGMNDDCVIALALSNWLRVNSAPTPPAATDDPRAAVAAYGRAFPARSPMLFGVPHSGGLR